MPGGTASSVQSPNMVQAPYVGQTAGNALQGIEALTGWNLSNPNQFNKLTKAFENSPFAPQAQTAANQAAPWGQQQAFQQYGTGQQLTNLGAGALPAWAESVMGTAIDPRQALYNRTLQQTLDQTQAANAGAGVGTTPYGAGLTADAIKNFNIDWQDQQLRRQLAGLSGAGSAIRTGADVAQIGTGMEQQAPMQYATYGGLPWQVAQQIYGAKTGGLNQQQAYGNTAATLPQQQIQDTLAYLGWGNQANAVANNLFGQQLRQNALNFDQWQTIGKDIGSLAGLGGGFGGGNAFNTPFTNPNMNWF